MKDVIAAGTRKRGIVLRKGFFFLSVPFVSLLIAYLFIKSNPPLSADGVSLDSRDPTKIIVELTNRGFADIGVREVYVNGKAAKKAELGVSTSSHLVLGADIENDPNISFHRLRDIPITPNRNGTGLYGIIAYGEEAPERVTVDYSYLGIRLSLDVPERFITK